MIELNLETFSTIASLIGLSSLISFFVQRYFSKKDEHTRQIIKKQNEEQAKRDMERKKIEEEREKELRVILDKVEIGLETIKLLSYHRMSDEIEKLLDKNFATPAERNVIELMFTNYKQHGWNGDMDERMAKVRRLRTDNPHEEK